jgi:hypothetical protein
VSPKGDTAGTVAPAICYLLAGAGSGGVGCVFGLFVTGMVGVLNIFIFLFLL